MTSQRRRRFTAALLATQLSVMALPHLAQAQAQSSYPDHPIKFIVSFGPGTASDLIARTVGDGMRVSLHQPFVVENRPGASGFLAATAAARAPADGYTVFLTSNSTHSINPHIFKTLPYDPIADFTPIGGIANFPYILAVQGSLPVKTPQELVAYARERPGQMNYAYGTPGHRIPAEAINRLAKLGATGIPYKSSTEALNDVVGGRAQFIVVDYGSARPHLQSGRLRALAVTTARGSGILPNLPTIEQTLGLRDFDMGAWSGMHGPAGLPRDITQKLSNALALAMARTDVQQQLAAAGGEPTPLNATAFAELVRDQLKIWGGKVAEAGIQPE